MSMMNEIKKCIILGQSTSTDVRRAIRSLPLSIGSNSTEQTYDDIMKIFNMIQYSELEKEMTNKDSLYLSSLLEKFQESIVKQFLNQLILQQLPLCLLTFKDFVFQQIIQQRFLSSLNFEASSVISNQPQIACHQSNVQDTKTHIDHNTEKICQFCKSKNDV